VTTGHTGAQPEPKRALVLAGGGLKVAFQAGALQVLLDELAHEHLRFEVADGASGGIFNLAMWCQGLTGREIADNWRRTSPGRYLWPRVGWPIWPFFSFRRFRSNVFSDWGIDPPHIRRGKNATFNLFDVQQQALTTRRADEMTEELLCACVALPGWFPPVEADGMTYVDAVFVTDANVEAVLAQGATELWMIWTVSRKGRLGRGPIGTFFQTVEETANGRLRQLERRIERSNAAGGSGEFREHITLNIIYGEVPIHYLLVFTRGQLARAVEQGVRETRAWCRLNDHELKEPVERPLPRPMRFSELLAGEVEWASTAAPWKLSLAVTARIDDIDAFMRESGRRARPTGTINCEELGGTLPIEGGAIDIFVRSKTTPGVWLIAYHICFRDSSGHPLTLIGSKRMTGRLTHVWHETTSLDDVRLLAGALAPGSEPIDGQVSEPLASGKLRLTPYAFLKTTGGLVRDTVWLPWLLPGRLAAGRYLSFFESQLWRLYGPHHRERTPVGGAGRASDPS
jgi:predicted acylesterase/phospholipase RssA